MLGRSLLEPEASGCVLWEVSKHKMLRSDDDDDDDLLAEPIGIFDLKIIANGNSLIFFLPQPIMFVDYV